MSKEEAISEKQISDWEARYGIVYELFIEGSDQAAYVHTPTADFKVMKMIYICKDDYQVVETIFNNCYLGGDKTVLKDKEVIAGMVEGIADILDVPERRLEKEGEHYIIKVEGQYCCKVRAVERGDVIYSLDQNKRGAAYLDNEVLLERVALDKKEVAELKKKDRMYLGALFAVKEAEQKKRITVRKRSKRPR